MSDLVEELRITADDLTRHTNSQLDGLLSAAADRIAELERQLAELRQPTAQQVEDARDANLREAVIDAAYDWSQYVEVDTAPRTCSEHIALAFDAALQAEKEKEHGN